MKTTHPISRRNFLKCSSALTGTLAVAPAFIPASVLGADGAVSPASRITLGMIGTGDHGTHRNLAQLLRQPDAQVVAVCDVASHYRERAREMVESHYAAATKQGSYKGCATYNDFRELLARKDIDAVMVSTPDHWHVIPAIMAAQSGKDVICEKPLTLTVVEGRALSNAMKKHQRIFQTSSENRSQEIKVYHRMVEPVRNGRIGKLKHIRVELPSGHTIRQANRETKKPPAGFDYDFWLGQAPNAPYSEARCHWNFRWNLDYSGGMLTDWGAHLIDIAQWGNDTEHTGPIEVEGQGEFPPRTELYNTATKFEVNCSYANGVTLTIASNRPGIRFEGTEGWIGNSGWAAPLQAGPKSLLDSQIGPNELHLYTAPHEHRNFLDCVKSRKPCYAPAEVGHRTISIAHLGNISMLLGGRKLKWNPATEQCSSDAEANKLLDRPRRDPWQLPKV